MMTFPPAMLTPAHQAALRAHKAPAPSPDLATSPPRKSPPVGVATSPPLTTIVGTILATDDAAYYALSDLDMRLLSHADLHLKSGVATLVPEAVADALAAQRENLVHHQRQPSWPVPTARQVIDGYSMLADRGLLLMAVIGVPGSLFVLVAPIGHQLDLVRRSADLVNLPAA